ncbi:MAG: ATP-binding protein [Bacteroidales bacterium]|nr:ATP-binding protein [Bacteroidales bacterium]
MKYLDNVKTHQRKTTTQLSLIALCVFSLFLISSCNRNSDSISEDLIINKQNIDELFEEFEKADGSMRMSYASAIFYQMVEEGHVDTLLRYNSIKDLELCNASLYYEMANYYVKLTKFNEAFELVEKALSFFEQHEGHDVKKALCWRVKGVCLTKQGEMELGLQLQVDAFNIIKETQNDELIISTLYSLAGTCCMMRQFDTAKMYVDDAIYLQRHQNVRSINKKNTNANNSDNQMTIDLLCVASMIYTKLNLYDDALNFSQEAYELDSVINGLVDLPAQLTFIANVYLVKGDIDVASEKLEHALEILEKYPDPQIEATIHSQLGNINYQQKNYEASERHYLQSYNYFCSVGNKYAEKNLLQSLAKVHEKMDPLKACDDLRRYIQMADSMNTETAAKALGDYRAQYETNKLELEAQQQHLRTKTIIWIFLSAFIIFVLAIVVLGYIVWLKQISQKRQKTFEQMKTTFFTNITHELRTPLTIILGYGQQLRRNELPNDMPMQQVGEMITRQGSQMLLLVNQLLDIVKITSNVVNVEYRSADIVSYVRMIVESHESLAKAKNIELSMQSEYKNFQMDFVPDYMHKIMRNLLSNAVKFTPEGGKIKVSLSFANNNVILSVADNGIGIPETEQTHIFEEFYQVSNAQNLSGTGIGLSLVVQVVKAMEGHIALQSEEGKGSTFTITLPQSHIGTIKEGVDEVIGEQIPERYNYMQQQMPKGVSDADAPIILIVEDNDDIARYVASQLRGRYRFYYAKNGSDGLNMAQEIVPDLIISDLMMPVMDGNQLCQEVRKSEILNHIPFVMLTAKASEKDKVDGLKAGADVYLYKPFNSDELNVSVEHLIQLHCRLSNAKLVSVKIDNHVDNAEKTAENVDVVTPVANMSEQGESSNTVVENQTDELMEARKAFLTKLMAILDELIGKKPIDVQIISEKIGLSSRQLSRKIQSITGETTINFLVHYRIDKAKEIILSQPDKPLAEIAIETGFEDAAYFSRVFKHEVGVSPSQYRKQLQSSK